MTSHRSGKLTSVRKLRVFICWSYYYRLRNFIVALCNAMSVLDFCTQKLSSHGPLNSAHHSATTNMDSCSSTVGLLSLPEPILEEIILFSDPFTWCLVSREFRVLTSSRFVKTAHAWKRWEADAENCGFEVSTRSYIAFITLIHLIHTNYALLNRVLSTHPCSTAFYH